LQVEFLLLTVIINDDLLSFINQSSMIFIL